MASLPPNLRTRIVGALACQRDSYLRILDTEVISCVKLSPQKAVTETKAKASKNSTKNDVASASPDLWSIEFTDSVLFPEGTSLDSFITSPCLANELLIRRWPTVRLWHSFPTKRSFIRLNPHHIRSTPRTPLCVSLPSALATWNPRTSRDRL